MSHLVQFGSLHIRIRFGLKAHSIRFAENRVIREMLQSAFKTELGCNVKRPLEKLGEFLCFKAMTWFMLLVTSFCTHVVIQE